MAWLPWLPPSGEMAPIIAIIGQIPPMSQGGEHPTLRIVMMKKLVIRMILTTISNCFPSHSGLSPFCLMWAVDSGEPWAELLMPKEPKMTMMIFRRWLRWWIQFLMMTPWGYESGYDNVAGNMWLGKLYFDLILANFGQCWRSACPASLLRVTWDQWDIS